MARSLEKDLRNASILGGLMAVGAATRELPIPMGKITIGTVVVGAGAEAVRRMRRRRRRLRME